MITPIMIREALRYIGIPSKLALPGKPGAPQGSKTTQKHQLDEATEHAQEAEAMAKKVEEGFKYLEQIATPRVTYQMVDIRLEADQVLLEGTSYHIVSKDLVKLFARSQKVILMAATLGMEVDKQIHLKQKIDMLDAVVLDACASVLIDKVCDEAELEIIETLGENEFLTMRFSPGYGDVPLETSRDLIDLLQATKRIGLSLTESCMLVPTKSVTALIGISNQKENRQKSCGLCNLVQTCAYRKRGEQCGV